MTVILNFQSLDDRHRARLVLDSPEAAARHVVEVLNDGRSEGDDLWTFDEDGLEVPTASAVIERLRGGGVRLYDQGNSLSGDGVVIEHAHRPR